MVRNLYKKLQAGGRTVRLNLLTAALAVLQPNCWPDAKAAKMAKHATLRQLIKIGIEQQ
jgi:hypothetical protein